MYVRVLCVWRVLHCAQVVSPQVAKPVISILPTGLHSEIYAIYTARSHIISVCFSRLCLC